MSLPSCDHFAPSIFRRILLVLDIGSVLFMGYLLYFSVHNPLMEWDSWSYHLPFAAYLWGIGDGEKGYLAPGYIQQIYAGFPLMGEWIQGMFWKATNDIRSVSLINPLSLIILCFFAWRWLRVRPYWIVASALSFPLIATHVVSTYLDLYVGAFLALVVVASVRLCVLVNVPSTTNRSLPTLILPALVLIAGSTLVANSKLQAWLWVLPLLVVLIVLLSCSAAGRTRRWRILVAGLLLLLICSATQLRNLKAFGNPLYPFILHVDPLSVRLDPGLGKYAEPSFSDSLMLTPDYAGHSFLSQPIYFLASASEIDWWIRGITPFYNIDMHAGDQNRRQIRTGGLWGIYVGFQLLLCVLSLVGLSSNRSEHRFLLLLFCITGLLVMCTPRAHELRYTIVWPLILILVTGSWIRGRSHRLQTALSLVVATFLVLSQSVLPIERSLFDVHEQPSSQSEWRKGSPAGILVRLRDGHSTCLEASEVDGHMWFRYSSAVIGGGHRIIAPAEYDLPCDPEEQQAVSREQLL